MSHKHSRHRIRFSILACGLLLAACTPRLDTTGIDDPSTMDDFHLDLPQLSSEEWVDRYDPATSFDGVNLVMYRRRIPMLMDMNGRILHTWPGVRAVGRARLNPDGSVAVIGRDNLIKEYDWSGELQWYYRIATAEDFPHHDFDRTDKGHYLVIVRSSATGMDHIHEVNRRGRVVWTWRAEDHLAAYFDELGDTRHAGNDPVHMNSVREIHANPWFAAGDERFRPGNILISARNLNMLFIIDRSSGQIVWTYRDGLDFQHEAVMVPEGQPGAGLVTVFNNGYQNLQAYRQSRIQAIDPRTNEVRWQYRHPGFYSSVAGSQQPLPNGNLLITSSESGRVFEITPTQELVWEWVPPYLPMRVERYPWNYCPQFSALERRPVAAVAPARTWAFIDMELYALTIPEEQENRRIDGRMLNLLPESNFCRKLWIPPHASIEMEFGFDSEQLQGRSLAAQFRATISSHRSGETRVLVDERVSSGDDPPWRKLRRPLSDLAFHRVDLCVATEVSSEMPEADAEKLVVWVKPRIRSTDVRTYSIGRPEAPQSAEEAALERQQLEALGYVQ